ncbi:MAG: peptidoglycan DD-metalloendopeptidase family protein [Myxococcales bacterium]|nr:peptidoglycan DD-metalloendopeptidase family protein [Myxococcales bacterium]
MKTKSRFWVWVSVGLLVVAAGAAAEQDLGIGGLTDVAAVEGKIAENLARVEHAQTRQAQIDTEISGLADKREEAEGRLHERARALYRIRRAGMLPVAGGFDALMGHLARVQRLSRMVKSDLETMDFLGERGSALRIEKNELADVLEAAQLALHALEGKKVELEHSSRSASLFQDTLRGERQDAPRDDEGMSYGRIRVSGDMDDLGDGFAQMRGQLALPVQGSMRIGESSREGAPGLEFYGRPGGPVRAAADGRVAFARVYGAYGLMVIIDHGSSFYTVYGGLGSTDVEVGDWVGMSTRIATLESVGPDAILFFEVRRGTRPLDARSWLGL